MRIVIIEDEVLMAKDLSESLKQLDPAITIVATLSSVEEALEYFAGSDQADLIFSDIELEDGLSFEIFKQIKIDIPVIFCTAYDQYALDAFNANGVEYILKPFNDRSLKKALDKYNWLRSTIADGLARQYKAASEALLAYKENKSSTLMVRYRHKVLPISFEQIGLVYIENDITYIYTIRGQQYVLQQTLDEMEKKLGANFFRVNRQFLVNRDTIVETTHTVKRKLSIAFSFSFHREVLVSKEKTTKFLQWIAQ